MNRKELVEKLDKILTSLKEVNYFGGQWDRFSRIHVYDIDVNGYLKGIKNLTLLCQYDEREGNTVGVQSYKYILKNSLSVDVLKNDEWKYSITYDGLCQDFIVLHRDIVTSINTKEDRVHDIILEGNTLKIVVARALDSLRLHCKIITKYIGTIKDGHVVEVEELGE